MIAIELEAASQRLFPHQPPDDRFAELMDAVLDSHNISRAVIMGHSLGSAYATMTATRDGAFGTKKKRISGVVLIDPIACNLHHARTTREFVHTRIETVKDSFEDFLFKKELWTSIVIARKLSWHEGSMWPDDCVPSVPTLVAVGTSDSIVPSSSVRQSFGSWQARLRGARVITMEGCGHGEWLFDQGHGERLVAAAMDLRIESARIGDASAAAGAAAAATAATITGLTGSGLGHSELKWAVEEVTAADAAADAASGASDAAADAEHVGWPVAWMAADLERQYSKRTAELASLVGSAFDEADRDGTLRAFLSLDQVSRAVAERLGMNVEVKAPMEAAMEAAMEATTAQATEAAEAKASEVAAVAAQATTVASTVTSWMRRGSSESCLAKGRATSCSAGGTGGHRHRRSGWRPRWSTLRSRQRPCDLRRASGQSTCSTASLPSMSAASTSSRWAARTTTSTRRRSRALTL